MKKYAYRIGQMLLLLYLPAALLGLWSASTAWGQPDFMEKLNHFINPWLWLAWLLPVIFGGFYLVPWLLLIFVLPIYLLVCAWIEQPTRRKAIVFIALAPLTNPFQTVLPGMPNLIEFLIH